MRQCPVCQALYDDASVTCPADAASLTPPDPLLGATVDRKYRVEAALGCGSMGTVYRALQLNLERRVAIKVVRRADAGAVALKRFQREALAIARLRHPNIVTIHDSGSTDDGAAYFVMELVEGPSLREEIERRGRFELADARALMLQVCSAIGAAHDVGVTHRDLKPENVMLERRGGELEAKVLDFGAAKLHSERDADRTTLTSHRTKLGTPMYMSPELAASQPADRRSDIYSLGCILYEMLAGRPPFLARTVAMVLLKHRGEPPRPPSALVDGLPPEVDALVLRALAKSPDERFQSAAILGRAIDEALAPAAPRGRPKTRSQPVRRAAERTVR